MEIMELNIMDGKPVEIVVKSYLDSIRLHNYMVESHKLFEQRNEEEDTKFTRKSQNGI